VDYIVTECHPQIQKYFGERKVKILRRVALWESLLFNNDHVLTITRIDYENSIGCSHKCLLLYVM
jgi:hypothetical protein